MILDPYIDFKNLKENYLNLNSPKGNVVFITGGAGRIGSIFSSIFIINKFKVYVLSRSKRNFLKFASSVEQPYRKNLFWLKVDLSKPKTINKLFNKIGKIKKIDYLVNNAAFHFRGENIEYNESKLTKEFFGLIGGTILLTEKVLKKMRESKRGNIINVGSIWGVSAPKFQTYLEMDIAPSLLTSICKSGVGHMTKYLAAREAKYNINVNNLSPGWFPRKGKKVRNDYVNMIRKDIPAKKIGKLDDLITAINFLISSGTKYYSGQTLKVDGGHSIW